MQMDSHMIGNKESDLLQQRGRVLATKGSRTGILTKTGERAVYSPFNVAAFSP